MAQPALCSPHIPHPILCTQVLPLQGITACVGEHPRPFLLFGFYFTRVVQKNNDKCKFLWEQSNKFHVPINVTAYLLEKFFVIYVSPLPLLTSLVPCWSAFLCRVPEYTCYLYSSTSDYSAHSSEGTTSRMPSMMPTKIHLPSIISCHCCRYLKSQKV